jgi:hypothetical protein
MSAETAQILEAIATKLGTTTEFLWAILVKQASINGIISCVSLVFCIVLWLLALFVPRHYINKYYQKTKDDGIFVMYMFVIAGLGLLLMPIYFNITTAITALTNPEYLALKEILRSIR